MSPNSRGDGERTTSFAGRDAPSADACSHAEESRVDSTTVPVAPDSRVEIPGYVILGEIARGGMGRVLAARELALEREAAIKILLPGADAGRFLTESRITARLPHPGIPPVYALGRLLDGSPFLAMKLVRGETLANELNRRTDLLADLPRQVLIFEQICQAVGFAHARGIIHRDLKPANVMLGPFGEVLVMDWGLAKALMDEGPGMDEGGGRDEAGSLPASSLPPPSSLTLAGAVLGTPSFMAPEQARGQPVDARADVFALGAILFNILTGQTVYAGTTPLQRLENAAVGNFADKDRRLAECGADAELIAVAQCCLRLEASDRPADAQQVAGQVAAYRQGVERRLRRAEAERGIAEARALEQRKRRRVILTAAGAIAALVVLGLSAVIYFGWRDLEQTRQVANETEGRLAAEREKTKTEQLRLLDNFKFAQKLARESGNSREVIDIVDRVKKCGLDVPAEMELEAISAHLDLGEMSEFDCRLASFQQVPGELQARVRLLQGQREIGRDDDRARVLLNAAIALGLPESMRLLAAGLIEEEPLKSIADFEQSIRLDPHALKPRIFLALGLTTLGRFPEALTQADQIEILSPNHVHVPTVRMIVFGYQGKKAAALEQHAKLKGRIPDELHKLQELYVPLIGLMRPALLETLGGPPVPEINEIKLRLLLSGFGVLPKNLHQSASDSIGAKFDTPPAFRRHAALMTLLGEGASGKGEGGFTSLDDPKIEKVRAEVAKFPEGVLHWMFSMRLMFLAEGKGKVNLKARGVYLKAARAAAEASQLPSIFPIDDIALDSALICYTVAGAARNLPVDLPVCEEARPLILRRLKLEVDRPFISSIDTIAPRAMTILAMELKDFPLARKCLDHWLTQFLRMKVKPDAKYYSRRAQCELELRSYETALEAALESEKLGSQPEVVEIIKKCREKLK
jgi:serine/threonine protein kinase